MNNDRETCHQEEQDKLPTPKPAIPGAIAKAITRLRHRLEEGECAAAEEDALESAIASELTTWKDLADNLADTQRHLSAENAQLRREADTLAHERRALNGWINKCRELEARLALNGEPR